MSSRTRQLGAPGARELGPLIVLLGAGLAVCVAVAVTKSLDGQPFYLLIGVPGAGLCGWALYRIVWTRHVAIRDVTTPSTTDRPEDRQAGSSPPWTALTARPSARLARGGVDTVPDRWLWIAMLRLALTVDSGRLAHPGILAAGARGALLIDLVTARVISRDEAGRLALNTDPGAVPLGPEMLADLADHPRRTLGDHIQRGRPHLSQFTNTLLELGVWTANRTGLDPRSHRHDAKPEDYFDYTDTVQAIATGSLITHDPHSAALGALTAALNLRWLPTGYLDEVHPDVLDACGEHAWIVRAVTTQLIGMQGNDSAAGSHHATTTVWQLGSSQL